MRKLLLFLLMCVCTGVNAQTKEVKDSTSVIYCEVIYNARNEAFVKDPYSDAGYFVVDESSSNIQFSTRIAMLNYFVELGWEYVDMFSTDSVMTLFLIRIKGKNRENVFDGMKLKRI